MTDGKMIIIFLTFLRASRELKAPARRKPDVLQPSSKPGLKSFLQYESNDLTLAGQEKGSAWINVSERPF